jgi:hypothetical protein
MHTMGVKNYRFYDKFVSWLNLTQHWTTSNSVVKFKHDDWSNLTTD